MRATIAGLTLDGDAGHVDAAGCRWVLESLEGWDDGVDVVVDQTQRPTSHGEFAEAALRSGRLVIASGFVACPDRVAAVAVKRTLSALLADGGFADLGVVDDDGVSLSASVRIAAAPSVVLPGWSTTVRFQLSWRAPDPLRYGPLASVTTGFPDLVGGLRYPLYTDGAGTTLGWLDYGEPSTSGAVTLSNPGTATTHPQFEVTGPAHGFEIIQVGTGRRLVYDGLVPPGSHLVIDTASGVAVMDGVSDRTLTWRDPMAIPPGETVEFAFIPRGEWSPAALRASARPAYW